MLNKVELGKKLECNYLTDLTSKTFIEVLSPKTMHDLTGSIVSIQFSIHVVN